MVHTDGRRRRLAVTIAVTALAVTAAITGGAHWLDAHQQGWLLLGCTVISVSAATSLFWLTDHELGWVTLAAVLLAVTPLAVGKAADEIVLASSGHLDSCVVTGVEVEPGLADAFRTVRYLHRLDCSESGAQEMQLATPSARAGQQVSIWVDDTGHHGAVARHGSAAPSASADVLLALVVLVGLALSAGAAVRQSAKNSLQHATASAG